MDTFSASLSNQHPFSFLTLEITQVHCQGCANKIKSRLQAFAGVQSINLDINEQILIIEKDCQTSAQEIIKALSELGYPASIPSDRQLLTWYIPRLSCQNCVNKITSTLKSFNDVQISNIDLQAKTITVELSCKTSSDPLIKQLEAIGYPIQTNQNISSATQATFAPLESLEKSSDSFNLTSLQQDIFDIQGMSCSSCVARIEKALYSLKGVTQARVNLATEKATVTHHSNLKKDRIIAAIQASGYQAQLHSTAQKNQKHSSTPTQAFIFSAILTLPFIVSMIANLFNSRWHLPILMQFIVASIIQFTVGLRFYKNAWHALKAKMGNMDLLIAIGTSSAYGLSIWEYLIHKQPHIYFETSAIIITLVLLGKWLEAQAKQKATQAIHALNDLRPEYAVRIQNDIEQRVAISEIQLQDIVIVKAGEKIPIDGMIIQGQTSIDEAMITGESLPVVKQIGESVKTGTINGDGVILIKVTAIGEQTLLTKIIQLVEEAQTKKAPVEHLVDKMSAIFVPCLIIVALITLIGWYLSGASIEHAILNAVSVLVIACPCALGLATPSAIIVGTSVAARYGILIKDTSSLEIAHQLNTVVFDKTGTLTEGKPYLFCMKTLNISEENALLIAAQLQQHSEHPLAKAIHLAYEKTFSAPLSSKSIITPKTLPGRGIQGIINDQFLAIGSSHWLLEKEIQIPPDWRLEVQTLEKEGCTISWLFELTPTPQLLALFAFKDQLKASSKQAINALEQQHIRTILLTGDNLNTANQIAKDLGINEVYAEVLPDQKSQIIKKLQTQHRCVAMVGDGINDTPALATADVGIAMASGVDVAVHTANITLMRNDPLMVSYAIDIARHTYRKIKQNLFWAFAYNVISIPLAAFGLLNPIIGSLAMALSSVSVLTNALLLNYWEVPKRRNMI